MSWLRRMLAESSARHELRALTERLGLPTVPIPGLLAAMDQHAAAVRDILTFSGSSTDVVDLAAYAEGVRDAAGESGWQPSAHAPGEWADDWVNVRLAAVCMLSRMSGSVQPAGGEDVDLAFD